MTQQQQGRRGLIMLLAVLALLIAGADQATKYLAEERLTQGVIVPLVGDFLGLQLIYNPGAAFSLATGMTWVFTLITLVVVVVVVRVARKLRSRAWAVALGMLLGGALGNLYDRLLREPGFARGHVVDFINYNGWFVGNVADIAIVLAAVLVAVLALVGIEIDGTRVPGRRDEGEEDSGPATDVGEDLSEEPLTDDGDFSAEVPRASEDGVDVASWVSGAPAAEQAPADGPVPTDVHRPAEHDQPTDDDAADPFADEPSTVPAGEPRARPHWAAVAAQESPAEPEADPVGADESPALPEADPVAADDEAGPVPAEESPAHPGPTSTRRPRSRREIRLATDDDA